jgi:hypothetical protein
MARGWAMETVENSAKNNCAEFSTVPTAPTTISFKKEENRMHAATLVQNCMDKKESEA